MVKTTLFCRLGIKEAMTDYSDDGDNLDVKDDTDSAGVGLRHVQVTTRGLQYNQVGQKIGYVDEVVSKVEPDDCDTAGDSNDGCANEDKDDTSVVIVMTSMATLMKMKMRQAMVLTGDDNDSCADEDKDDIAYLNLIQWDSSQ